jgi:hypothetical protein
MGRDMARSYNNWQALIAPYCVSQAENNCPVSDTNSEPCPGSPNDTSCQGHETCPCF